MSYILDALRKSDQQRRQGAAPITRLTQEAVAAPRRSAISLNGVLALVLIGVGITIGWLRPWQTAPSAPAPVVAPPATPDTAPVVLAPALPETPPSRMPAPVVTNKRPPAAKPVTDPSDAIPAAMTMAELPPEIRQEIPGLAISLHSYSSTAAERVTMINGTLMKEGDTIAPGLRLEQITAEGVVLGYKGYRIPRGLR